MIVIDASVVLDALTDDGPLGDRCQARLADDPHWIAPTHLLVEATSAIRGRWLGQKISSHRADQAVAILNQLTISYVPWGSLAARVWEFRHNLTPYDAAYIALAESRGCPLVTTDAKLRDGAWRCPVDVVDV